MKQAMVIGAIAALAQADISPYKMSMFKAVSYS